MPATPERLRSIRKFDELIRYLEDELEWPLQQYGFDGLTFTYEPRNSACARKTPPRRGRFTNCARSNPASPGVFLRRGVHSPAYRSRYAEFLKIDFPRLPLTGNLELFRALAKLGVELVSLHLLEFQQKETKETKSSFPSLASVSGSEASSRVYPALTTFIREGVKSIPTVEKLKCAHARGCDFS